MTPSGFSFLSARSRFASIAEAISPFRALRAQGGRAAAVLIGVALTIGLFVRAP